MTFDDWLPLLVVLSSLITGLIIFVGEEQHHTRPGSI